MNLLLEMGLSNTVSTALLAAVVLMVTRIRWNSHIAWVLWFIVLLKLVVPPLVSVPLPEQLSFRLSPAPDTLGSMTPQQPVPPEQRASVSPSDQVNTTELPLPPTSTQTVTLQSDETDVLSSDKTAMPPISIVTEQSVWIIALNWAGWLWLSGSAIWFVLAAVRIGRFHRQVQKAVPALPEIQSLVDSLAMQMKIKRAPRVLAFEGRVSPLLWPVGRRLSILLPRELLCRLDSDQQTTLIAHELAHVRRRDYLVRWFELFVLGLYWWNPIAWWARQQLQQAEEQCCDALVIATLPTKAKQYAQAIFETVEFLSAPQPLRTPVVSGFMFHFNIHRRPEMIVQGKTKSQLSPVWKSLLLFIGIALLAVGPMSLLAEPHHQEEQTEKKRTENAENAHTAAGQQSEAAEKSIEEASPAQEPSTTNPDKSTTPDPELINDLKQMQGTWELYHGNEHNGAPNTHSVKTIEGNRETLRRYTMQGKLVREHSVEFILEKDGDFKIFTFYPVGGKPEQGYSFLYRVQGDRFFDVPGLFAGKKHRNYLKEPAFWVWHRVKEEDQPKAKDPVAPSSEATSTPPKADAAPKQNQPEPETANEKKETALAPPLKFIISIMPGDHIFVGHKHNNKYNHHTLSSLEDHLKKTKPKQVTLAIDIKADTAFTQRVIALCKELDVQTIDQRKTSNIPAVKATPSEQPADNK